MAGHKVRVLKIKLLPNCLYERGRMVEIEGPNITVLVLLVLHSICCLVGLSLFVDLQIDCFPIAYLVVELQLQPVLRALTEVSQLAVVPALA